MISRGSIFRANSSEKSHVPRLKEEDTKALWSLLKTVKTRKTAYELFAKYEKEDDTEDESQTTNDSETAPRNFSEGQKSRAQDAQESPMDEESLLSSHSDVNTEDESTPANQFVSANEFVNTRLESTEKEKGKMPDWDQFFSMECYPSLTTESPSLNSWSIPRANTALPIATTSSKCAPFQEPSTPPLFTLLFWTQPLTQV